VIDELNKEFKVNQIKLLEVCSGLLSNLACEVDNNLFDNLAIDPLADIHNSLMAKYHYDYPIKPIKVKCENLLKLFRENSFHICYSRNAIDHTEDPERCIFNMYSILKKNGILFLIGFVREESHEKWVDLHQFDLIPENRDLFLGFNDGNKKNITNNLRLRNIIFDKTRYNPGDFYKIAFKKY